MPAQTRKPSTPKKTATRSKASEPKTSPSSRYGSGWSRGDTSGIQDVELPSGSFVLARKPGTQGLIEAGVLEKMDPLTAIVNRKIIGPAQHGEAADTLGKVMSREELILLIEVCDRVAAWCVIEPNVRLAPTPQCAFCKWEGNDIKNHKNDDHTFVPVPLDPDVVYTDAIPMDDKMAILQFATEGAVNLEPFRKQRAEAVEALSAVESLRSTT